MPDRSVRDVLHVLYRNRFGKGRRPQGAVPVDILGSHDFAVIQGVDDILCDACDFGPVRTFYQAFLPAGISVIHVVLHVLRYKHMASPGIGVTVVDFA
jgi:hypothetical protein